MQKLHSYQLQAKINQVMANPIRLQLFDAFGKGESSVGDLVTLLGYPQPTISRHLKEMKQANLVISQRDSQNVIYRVSNPKTLEISNLVDEIILEHLDSRINLLHGIN